MVGGPWWAPNCVAMSLGPLGNMMIRHPFSGPKSPLGCWIRTSAQMRPAIRNSWGMFQNSLLQTESHSKSLHLGVHSDDRSDHIPTFGSCVRRKPIKPSMLRVFYEPGTSMDHLGRGIREVVWGWINDMGVSINGGTPKWMLHNDGRSCENPMKLHDLGAIPFSEPSIFQHFQQHQYRTACQAGWFASADLPRFHGQLGIG
jgi:hypothetical protein